MGSVQLSQNRDAMAQKTGLSPRWQTVVFGSVHLDDQGELGTGRRRRRQDTDSASLDLAYQGVRRHERNPFKRAVNNRSIIRDKRRAERNKLQCERGFPTSGCAPDQHPAVAKRNTGRVKGLGAVCILLGCVAIPRRKGHGSHRQPHDKACAKRFRRGIGIVGANVLCPDHTIVRFDDLLRDGQTKT